MYACICLSLFAFPRSSSLTHQACWLLPWDSSQALKASFALTWRWNSSWSMMCVSVRVCVYYKLWQCLSVTEVFCSWNGSSMLKPVWTVVNILEVLFVYLSLACLCSTLTQRQACYTFLWTKKKRKRKDESAPVTTPKCCCESLLLCFAFLKMPKRRERSTPFCFSGAGSTLARAYVTIYSLFLVSLSRSLLRKKDRNI